MFLKIIAKYRDRLTEPLHLNLVSAFVALFGSYRTKVAFDLVNRRHYAFSMMFAADDAKRYGKKSVTVIEFGVAGGAGLLNMCRIAERTRQTTGINFNVVGFDAGTGMPPPVDYRDFPEEFQEGDFPLNFDALKALLPPFASIVLGDVADTVPKFLATLSSEAPIGFVAMDVDYYSSAKQALAVFAGKPDLYLPVIPLYLDDIAISSSNPWRGELLAINEFNSENSMRKIAPLSFLRPSRIFKNPQWIDQMYAVHTHDHASRTPAAKHDQVIDLTLDGRHIVRGRTSA
jgi:hypothetical protein